MRGKRISLCMTGIVLPGANEIQCRLRIDTGVIAVRSCRAGIRARPWAAFAQSNLPIAQIVRPH